MFSSEQSFVFQFFLEFQEALEQVADTGASGCFDVELEIAARFIKGDKNAGFNVLPVFQAPSEQLRTVAEQDAAHLRVAVLQREIDMPGSGIRQIGYLAGNPAEGEGRFQSLAGKMVEQRYGQDGSRNGGGWREERGFCHASILHSCQFMHMFTGFA